MSPLVLAAIPAAFAVLGAYLVAARQFSGKIGTSDAKELWAESRSIRDWSQRRIATLNENAERLEKRVEALETSNDDLIRQNKDLVAKIVHLEETIIDLRREVVDLTARLKASRNRVAELEEPDA